MNRLQTLITAKFNEGKSYNRLESEIGVNHVSLSQYHKKGVAPSGKNLALLAKYFRVDFWDLLEEVNEPSAQNSDQNYERRHSAELRLLFDELVDLSPTEQLELLLKIRREKEALRQ